MSVGTVLTVILFVMVVSLCCLGVCVGVRVQWAERTPSTVGKKASWPFSVFKTASPRLSSSGNLWSSREQLADTTEQAALRRRGWWSERGCEENNLQNEMRRWRSGLGQGHDSYKHSAVASGCKTFFVSNWELCLVWLLLWWNHREKVEK